MTQFSNLSITERIMSIRENIIDITFTLSIILVRLSFRTHTTQLLFCRVRRNLSLLALFAQEIETICYIENKRFIE